MKNMGKIYRVENKSDIYTATYTSLTSSSPSNEWSGIIDYLGN